MFRIPQEESKLLTCPYNISHQIRLARMPLHLMKCRKDHPDQEMVKCPFNITHHIHQMELDVHVQMCPERKYFEEYRNVAQDTPNDSAFADQESASFAELSYASEDWSEEKVPTYNPLSYAKAAPVLRLPQGLKPSERREFRENERKRLNDMGDKSSS